MYVCSDYRYAQWEGQKLKWYWAEWKKRIIETIFWFPRNKGVGRHCVFEDLGGDWGGVVTKASADNADFLLSVDLSCNPTTRELFKCGHNRLCWCLNNNTADWHVCIITLFISAQFYTRVGPVSFLYRTCSSMLPLYRVHVFA